MQTNERIRQESPSDLSLPKLDTPKVQVPIPSRHDSPQVEVLKDGEIVTSIRVSCQCGCTVDIDCQYE